MRLQSFCCFAFAGVLCCLTSCSEPSGPKIKKVPVVPVQGTVTIDGNPEMGVVVRCIPQGSFEVKEYEKSLGGRTDEAGKFKLSTYEAGDGLPPGEYALTFNWPPPVSLTKSSGKGTLSNDRLNGKYGEVEKSPLKFTVEKGKPLELEEIDLKTK